MTTLRFYYFWWQLGRGYWKARHLWTILAYLENASKSLAAPARSVADDMYDWLAAQEPVNPEATEGDGA